VLPICDTQRASSLRVRYGTYGDPRLVECARGGPVLRIVSRFKCADASLQCQYAMVVLGIGQRPELTDIDPAQE